MTMVRWQFAVTLCVLMFISSGASAQDQPTPGSEPNAVNTAKDKSPKAAEPSATTSAKETQPKAAVQNETTTGKETQPKAPAQNATTAAKEGQPKSSAPSTSTEIQESPLPNPEPTTTAVQEKQQPAPAPSPPPSAPDTQAAPGASAPSTASYAQELKLRGLEERVNELKEKIFRTKARILQLQETVVSGAIGAGARAVIVHRNEMGGSFKLVSVQYALDTAPIFKKVDVNGNLDSIEEREIDSRNIVPGNHNIAVQMVFMGQGYGFFSYVKGYKFTVTSSYTFTAEEGKIIKVKVVAFERGGITTKLEERPAIRYDIEIEKLTPDRAKTLQGKTEGTS